MPDVTNSPTPTVTVDPTKTDLPKEATKVQPKASDAPNTLVQEVAAPAGDVPKVEAVTQTVTSTRTPLASESIVRPAHPYPKDFDYNPEA